MGNATELSRKALDYLTTGIIYYITGITLHEYFHYQIATLLGYKASIHFPTWISGYVSAISKNTTHTILIGLAGGGLTALFFLLTSLFTKDTQTDIVLGFFTPIHGFYAVFEVLYLLEIIPLRIVGTVPVLLSAPMLVLVINRRVNKS